MSKWMSGMILSNEKGTIVDNKYAIDVCKVLSNRFGYNHYTMNQTEKWLDVFKEEIRDGFTGGKLTVGEAGMFGALIQSCYMLGSMVGRDQLDMIYRRVIFYSIYDLMPEENFEDGLLNYVYEDAAREFLHAMTNKVLAGVEEIGEYDLVTDGNSTVCLLSRNAFVGRDILNAFKTHRVNYVILREAR